MVVLRRLLAEVVEIDTEGAVVEILGFQWFSPTKVIGPLAVGLGSFRWPRSREAPLECFELGGLLSDLVLEGDDLAGDSGALGPSIACSSWLL